MRVAFWKQKAVDILFRFLRTSTEYWIGNGDRDFVMLSFSFLAPNGVPLNFEFHWVVHFNTDICSEQVVHLSVMRLPLWFYGDVQRFGSRSVLLNAEECYRKEGAEACRKGKVPVFILLSFAICVRCCCCVCVWVLFLFLFLFQVPLTSCASPWRAGETKNGARPKF
jgi:hypothetical protein